MSDSPANNLFNLSEQKRLLLEKLIRQEGLDSPVATAIPSHDRAKPVPLSFAQERLWFLAQLEPHNYSYNIPLAVLLNKHLKVDVLQQSFCEIIRRHEALRTSFPVGNDGPVQRIDPFTGFILPLIDLSAMPEDQIARESQQIKDEEACFCFDLSEGPLFKAKLVRLKSEEHLLLLTMHHIISDGWSMEILYQELSLLYEAFSSNKPSPLPELPVQYADFAVWQRQWLQGEVMEKQLTYWRQQLKGALPVLELPADRPRPPVKSYRGGTHSFELSKDLVASLKAISRRQGATLFMTLAAALKVLLFRYSGQKDILIGTPIANRNRVEIENLIGFFVNTLVLRTDLSGNPSFLELLGRMRETALGAYTHQDLPFEKLVEDLQPERDLSRSPLFQVMFVLQELPASELKLSGLAVDRVEVVDIETSKFDLTLSMTEDKKNMSASFEYNTDIFEADTIKRMADHFMILLEGIVAGPEQLISELPLLTDTERNRILIEWNDTGADFPTDMCIHELFEAQVEKTPDAVALIFEGQQINYGELNRRANRIAHHLRELRVRPDDRVALCVERSLEMVIGLLAILKAGGAYVPLDPDYPVDRLGFMVEDSQPAALMTKRSLAALFPGLDMPVIHLDAENPIWTNQPGVNPERCSLAPSHLAYVMYTSGSTGKPKGVMISHRNVVGFLYSYKHVTQDGEKRIGTMVAPFCFDTSVEEMFSTLCFGGTLHIIRPENSADAGYFASYLVEQNITTAYNVPDVLPDIAECLRGMKERLRLKCLITGLTPKNNAYFNTSGTFRMESGY